MLSTARRFGATIEPERYFPFVSSLAEVAPDQAVLLMARLRMDKVRLPREVYLRALLGMIKAGDFKLGTTRVQSVLKMLSSDDKASSVSNVFADIIAHVTTIDDLKLVHTVAVAEKLQSPLLYASTLAAYLNVTANILESSQRHCAWWILRTIRKYELVDKLMAPAHLHLAVGRLQGCDT